MPGTHYDNDHSFIEELPFEYKKVAYQIIRSDSLEIMLIDLKSQYSKHFEDFPNPEELDVKMIEHTLCACIIAKITSFTKALYLDPLQALYLEQTLQKAFSAALELKHEHAFSPEALAELIEKEYPKTQDWLSKTPDTPKPNKLTIRSRRENTRRYFRYTAPLTYHFIRIGNHEKVKELQGDIYSSGVKHFNKIVNGKLDTLVLNYTKNIKMALQADFPAAHDLFMVVLEKSEYLREVLNGVSVGQLNIQTAKRFLNENIKNTVDYSSLGSNARTEALLHDIEEKLNQINNATLELLDKSTPHKLYSGPVLDKIKIDHDIRGYIDKNKKIKSKLLTAFLDLYHYMLLLERIYNNISASNYIIIFPEYWTDFYQDISPGGFAFFSEFLVEENDVLELFFRINMAINPDMQDYEIINQRAKVVRTEEREDLGCYLIGCEFMNAESETIQLIESAYQTQEVRDAYNSSGLLGEEDGF